MTLVALKMEKESRQGNLERLATSFREQSYLWRTLTLLQIPVTIIAISAAIIMYVNSDTLIEVIPRPAPGYYLAEEIPDEEFIKYAIDFTNLIASFQQETAEKQFNYALNYLMEPILTVFKSKFIDGVEGNLSELQKIKESSLAQMFFINRDLIIIRRKPDRQDPKNDLVEVRIPGEYNKFLAGKIQNSIFGAYYIRMKTFPKTNFNPNGIYIVDFELELPKDRSQNAGFFNDLRNEDKTQERKSKSMHKKPPFARYNW